MARKLKADFTGVENFVKCTEGEHVVVLKEIEEKASSAGNEMLAVTFEVSKGTCKGAKLYDNFVLTEKALWKLKSYLEVVGVKADGKIVIDLDKLIGKVCIVDVIHEEYNGNMKARIDSYKKIEIKSTPVEDEDFDEDEEDEPTPPPKKKVEPKKVEKKKPAPAPVEDEDDDDDWDED